MKKREITETVYEYDGEGKLIRKTVTQTKEEEDESRYNLITSPNIISATPYKVTLDTNNDSICRRPNITCCKEQD